MGSAVYWRKRSGWSARLKPVPAVVEIHRFSVLARVVAFLEGGGGWCWDVLQLLYHGVFLPALAQKVSVS